MNKELRELTFEEADLLVYKAESEGFDYCFTSYSSWDELEGTDVYPLIQEYRAAEKKLSAAIKALQKKHGIKL